MAKKLTIYTYDWVPQGPRGFVRDLRLRWAAEEAGFPYDVRTVTVPWWFLQMSGQKDNGLAEWMDKRLAHLEAVLAQRDWLAADRFTVADLIMTDVLRVSDVRAYGDRPATEAYIERVTTRPAFQKAHSDQITHFATADQERSNRG